MSADSILNSLNGYNDVQNARLAEIASQLKEITEQYNSGDLSASEYKELLEDIASETSIVNDAAALNEQRQLKLIIDTAITIAATAAKAI
jgi:polyhydroxyalkanoate synthesis regulator phasin